MNLPARYEYNDSVTKLLLPQREAQFAKSAAAINNRIVSPTFSPSATVPQPVKGCGGPNFEVVK